VSIPSSRSRSPTAENAGPSDIPHVAARGGARAFLQNIWSDVTGRKRYARYRELEDRRRRLLGVFLHLATLCSALVYLFWAARVLNWDVWYAALPFYAAEVGTLLTVVLFTFIIWHPRFHKPQGLGPSEDFTPTVDIFVSTCGEPIEILTSTVVAACAIRYPRKRVYILDDASREDVKALAWQMGCAYLHRNVPKDAKAGNLNHALPLSDGEFILALDADQIPDPEILERITGYMRMPSVALVQTAQRFFLPDGDPFGNSDELFYRRMQAGKDTHNAAFSCGSGVLYRRSALESVGGFSTWNLVEDVHTSMLLHDRGYRSIYHDHPLTTGTAPADIAGVHKQREQWATDSLRMFFWDNPLRRKGLTMFQKWHYFYTGYGYLASAFIMPAFFLVPIWSSLSGDFLLRTDALTYVAFRAPYLVLSMLMIVALEHPVDPRKPFRMWAGFFPIFIRATFRALGSRREKPGYHVTRKTPARPGLTDRIRPILPQIAIIIATILSLAYAARTGSLPWGLFLVNLAWGSWVVWTLLGICIAAFQSKVPPGDPKALR